MANPEFSNLSIRTQLIMLAVLLTLPALGIIVYSGLKDRSDNYQQAVIESQRLADGLAAQQEILTNEAKLLGILLAGLPEVKNRDIDNLQSILAEIHKQSPQYINIQVTDAEGQVWASAVPSIKYESVSDRRFFKSAQQTKRFSSGEFVISRQLIKPTIHMAYPLLDQNEFIDTMLTLAHISRQKLQLEMIDLSSLAEKICSELALTNPDRTLRFNISPGLQVTGDADLLQVALENLLGNACKYTKG